MISKVGSADNTILETTLKLQSVDLHMISKIKSKENTKLETTLALQKCRLAYDKQG